jgi:hypothetical protein
MREYERELFSRALKLSDKWLHLAIYLGYIAVDHGADKARIDKLIRETDKETIDKLLLERINNETSL